MKRLIALSLAMIVASVAIADELPFCGVVEIRSVEATGAAWRVSGVFHDPTVTDFSGLSVSAGDMLYCDTPLRQVDPYRVASVETSLTAWVDLVVEYYGTNGAGPSVAEGPSYVQAVLLRPAGGTNAIPVPQIVSLPGPSDFLKQYLVAEAIRKLSLIGGSGIPDAPADTNIYGRSNATWVVITPGVGPQGAPGTNGSDGANAYIAITNVVTLPFGSAPYASNEVVNGTNCYTLGIPSGSNGVAGADSGGTNSIDPNNRVLIASDGSTTNLDWSVAGELNAGANNLTVGSITLGDEVPRTNWNISLQDYNIEDLGTTEWASGKILRTLGSGLFQWVYDEDTNAIAQLGTHTGLTANAHAASAISTTGAFANVQAFANAASNYLTTANIPTRNGCVVSIANGGLATNDTGWTLGGSNLYPLSFGKLADTDGHASISTSLRYLYDGSAAHDYILRYDTKANMKTDIAALGPTAPEYLDFVLYTNALPYSRLWVNPRATNYTITAVVCQSAGETGTVQVMQGTPSSYTTNVAPFAFSGTRSTNTTITNATWTAGNSLLVQILNGSVTQCVIQVRVQP